MHCYRSPDKTLWHIDQVTRLTESLRPPNLGKSQTRATNPEMMITKTRQRGKRRVDSGGGKN